MALRRAGSSPGSSFRALNRPLTILGVERRGFLLAATLDLAMRNAMNSLVTGGVVFAVGYGAGRRDPDMIGILRAGRCPVRYDPGKWTPAPWHIRIRQR